MAATIPTEVGTAHARPAPGLLAGLREAAFRALWLNTFLNWFGAGFVMITMQEHVIQTLRAAGRDAEVVRLVGLVPFFALLPLFCFSIFAGVVADRVDRRRLLIAGQTARLALGVLFLVLFLAGQLTIPVAYGMVFALGAVQAFLHPTRLSLVPNLVPGALLLNAIALTNLAQHASMILGPVIAGLLLRWFGVAAGLAGHAGIMLVALLPLFGLRVPARAAPAAARPGGVAGVVHEIRMGLRDAWHNRILRTLLFTTALPGLFFIGPFTALVPLLARDVYGTDVSGQGLMQGVMGVGLIVGGLAVARRHDLSGLGRKMVAILIVGGASLLLIGTIPNLWLGLPLLFLWGLSGGIFFNLNLTLTQREVSDAMRGRIMSIVTLATQGCGPIGNLMATAIAASVGSVTTVALGVQHTLQLAAACVIVAATSLFVIRARVLQLD